MNTMRDVRTGFIAAVSALLLSVASTAFPLPAAGAGDDSQLKVGVGEGFLCDGIPTGIATPFMPQEAGNALLGDYFVVRIVDDLPARHVNR